MVDPRQRFFILYILKKGTFFHLHTNHLDIISKLIKEQTPDTTLFPKILGSVIIQSLHEGLWRSIYWFGSRLCH